MTFSDEPIVPRRVDSTEPAGSDDLDGHTIEELSDYLDHNCLPAIASIDESPACQIALEALGRLRTISLGMLEAEALAEAPRDESWISGIINSIGRDARAGRNIPVHHPSPTAHLTITEGAVRGMIRAAGDAVGGVLVGSCRLTGDVTVPGEPISVDVEVSVLWGTRITEVADSVRKAIYTELLKHTELTISAINVTVHDVLFHRAEPDDGIELP